MSRLSARLLALAALLILVTFDVVLVRPLLPAVKSLVSPQATATPSSTARPGVTRSPSPATQAAGTYWTCEATYTDTGYVTGTNATPPPGSVSSSALCDATYGETEPGQPQPQLISGLTIWRVPVGTFTPFVRCGVPVVNVVDPYDPQAAPQTWPSDHELLYDSNWGQLNC